MEHLSPNVPWRVSLTGADDATELAALHALGERYPSVEWALLYVPHNEGAPRNPTRPWRQAFFENPPSGSSAVHLCGSRAFEELLADALPDELLKADRLQLNINARRADFSREQVLHVFQKALGLGPTVILQYQPGTSQVIEDFVDGLPSWARKKVHVLLDASRGTGKVPTSWAVPTGLPHDILVGFAGGLGPDTLREALPSIRAQRSHYWVDMESGIRTENKLDLARCEQVLRRCSPP